MLSRKTEPTSSTKVASTTKPSQTLNSASTGIDSIQRAFDDPNPKTLTPTVVSQIQRTHGNHAVLQLMRRSDQNKKIQRTIDTEEDSMNGVVHFTHQETGLYLGNMPLVAFWQADHQQLVQDLETQAQQQWMQQQSQNQFQQMNPPSPNIYQNDPQQQNNLFDPNSLFLNDPSNNSNSGNYDIFDDIFNSDPFDFLGGNNLSGGFDFDNLGSSPPITGGMTSQPQNSMNTGGFMPPLQPPQTTSQPQNTTGFQNLSSQPQNSMNTGGFMSPLQPPQTTSQPQNTTGFQNLSSQPQNSMNTGGFMPPLQPPHMTSQPSQPMMFNTGVSITTQTVDWSKYKIKVIYQGKSYPFTLDTQLSDLQGDQDKIIAFSRGLRRLIDNNGKAYNIDVSAYTTELEALYQPFEPFDTSKKSKSKAADKSVIQYLETIIQTHNINGHNKHDTVRNALIAVIKSDVNDPVWSQHRSQLIGLFQKPDAAQYYTDTYVRAGSEHEQLLTSLTAESILHDLQNPSSLPKTQSGGLFTSLDFQRETNVPTHYVLLKSTTDTGHGISQNHHPTKKELISYIDNLDPTKLHSSIGTGSGSSPDYHRQLADEIKQYFGDLESLNQQLAEVNNQNLADREDILKIPAAQRADQYYVQTNGTKLHFNISHDLHLIARNVEVRRQKVLGLFNVVSNLLQTSKAYNGPTMDYNVSSPLAMNNLPQTPPQYQNN